MANPRVEVDFVANTASLTKGMSKAGHAAGGLVKGLGGLAKGGVIGAAIAGTTALAASLKIGFDEYNQGAKIAAQTNAVIKSTGGVANVTAGHVDALATALMNKSGVDDEVVKSGENMLLAFTNVRNEVGKGNAVFDRATQAALDLSTRLGTSMPAASKLLGKALNDPVKGMTALTKIGVHFTDAQKKQIAAMVKSGNVLGAQKIILGQVEDRYKGAAAAAGDTLPGKLNILKENFNNLAGDVVGKMIPAITTLVTWLTDHWGEISAAVTRVVNQVIIPAFKGMAAFVEANVIPVIRELIGWFVQHWPQISKAVKGAWEQVIKPALAGLFSIIKNQVIPVIGAVIGWIVANWPQISQTISDTWNQQIKPVLTAIWTFIQQQVLPAIQAAVAWIVAHWPEISKIIQDTWNTKIKPAIDAIGNIITGLVGIVTWVVQTIIDNWGTIGPIVEQVAGIISSAINVVIGIFKTIGAVLHGDWSKAWDDIKQVASDAWDAIVATLKLAGTLLWAAAQAVGKLILKGIKAELDALPGQLKALAELAWEGFKAATVAALGLIKTAIINAWDALPGIATAAWNALKSAVTTVLGALKTAVTTLGGDVVDGFVSGIKGAVHLVTAAVTTVKNAVVNFFDTAKDWLLEKGKAVINGYIDGIKFEIKLVTAAVGLVKDAVVGVFDGAKTLLLQVGKDVIQGFIDGIDAVWQTAVNHLVGLYNKLPSAVRTVLGALSPSKVFFAIGTDTVQGFVDGLNAKMPAAQRAGLTMAARAVEGAHQGLTGAGDKLSSFLSQAFSAHQAAAETPAAKQLRILQESHDDAGRAQALADAKAQVAAAQTADEKLQAQQALADAQYQIQVAALQKQADQEAKAQQGSQFVEQQAFDKRLAALQTYLDSAGATAEGARTRIKAITDRFGIDFSDVSALLGKGFAKGLRDSTDDVVAAAGDLAKAVKKALKKGLGIKSPSTWTRDQIGKPLVEGIVVGMHRSAGMLDQATRSLVSAVDIPQLSQSIVNQPTLSLGDSSNDVHVRVFIGDQELKGLVRTEIAHSNRGIARTLLAGSI